MKKMYANQLTAMLCCVLFSFAGCGDDHAKDDHPASGHNAAHDGKSKTQEELLDLFEENESPHREASVHGPAEAGNETQDASVHGGTSSSEDLEALLGGHFPVVGEPAVGARQEDKAEHGKAATETSEMTAEETHLLASETAASLTSDKLEDIVQELDASKRKLEKQIDTFKSMVEQRNDSINTLKKINQQLRDQISQLRRNGTRRIESMPVSGEIQVLRDELLKLKNTFTLKVKEVDELREYNKELLKKLDAIDPAIIGTSSRLPPVVKASPKPLIETETDLDDFPVIAPGGLSAKGIVLNIATGTLEFDAVVTAANGKIKEAFYTEFFVTRSPLRDILNEAGINLEQYKDVSSHAELWALSRKYPFRYPELQQKIRKALLDSIIVDENTSGQRIRTDIDGNSGEIKALVPGRYYIIGTASLGKVGVTWSVPVRVKSGHNKLSLTLANSSWSL